jgi:hypothetical protein
MPTNNSELPTLFIMGPDGTKMILGKIIQSEIITEDPYDFTDLTDNPLIVRRNQTATFTVEWGPNVDGNYLLVYGKLPSNNWRRIHGYRARRKRR